jgi:DNA-binding NtrC family response regulator
MQFPFEVMVVSADLERRRHLSDILANQGLDPICVSTLKQCHEALAHSYVGLVFCDPHLPDGSYGELIAAYRLNSHRPRVVLTSLDGDWDEFREAMRVGAFDVICSPFRPTDVEWMVIQAKRDERRRSEAALAAYPERPGDIGRAASAS